MKDRLARRVGQRRFAIVRSSRVWRRGVRFEPLENRNLLSALGLLGTALDSVFASPSAHASPTVTNTVPYGDTPAQIRTAYGFNQVTFNGTIAGNGAGQTIAIVDAYGDSTISRDLSTFDTEMGLPAAPSLKIVNQSGGSKLPGNNSGWALETSLDVEWAHAMAPKANLLLVEASSASLGNLLTAVSYASKHADVVSMSWGTSEFSSETSYDSYFSSPGVTFVAASGDSGTPLWPAVSPNVLGVGGTTLTLANSSGTYGSETGWSGSGGGVSQFESQPTYQSASGLVTQSNTNRTSPDVSYNADPNSGVAVYDSISYSGQSGWFQVGGTSAGAPQWAALVAVADQGRQLATTNNTPNPLPNAQASVYSAATTSHSTDFHVIASSNTGYDLVTGLGTPQASTLVQALVAATPMNTVTTTSTTKTGSGSPSTAADPSTVVELILLDLKPPAATGPSFVPLVVTPAPPVAAAASSLVMPAQTPVQFASNSLLTDDPTAVPFKPAKRTTSADGAILPSADTSPVRSAVWLDVESGPMDELWSTLNQTAPSPTDVADAVFATGSSEAIVGMADSIGSFALAETHYSPLTAALGLVAAAVLIEKGSRRQVLPIEGKVTTKTQRHEVQK
jgi:hypothetical protein